MDVAVEEVAADEQQQVLPAVRQHPVDRGDDEEEHDEVEAVEDHCEAAARSALDRRFSV